MSATTAPASHVVAAAVEAEAGQRLLSPTFERWAEQAANCGHCARPIRLRGQATTVDRATGEVLSTYDSATEPDGVLYARCGNRRASVCPSCSHEYKGDMWHLLAAGAAGGMKGVPESVATHPLVFATLTAPSFGAVHGVRRRSGRPTKCRPRATSATCEHGRPLGCRTVHAEGDRRLGQPLCAQCYDYTGHVVWQWWAPELWRRFTITLRRVLAASLALTQKEAHALVRVSFAKVAEFQRRGVVHFHALIRLDGPPTRSEEFPAPLIDVSAQRLCELVHIAASRVWFDAPATAPGEPLRRLRFGAQVDARAVTADATRETGRADDPDEGLHPETVAAYIAKYATKACDDFGLPPQLRDPEAARRMGIAEHVCRLLAEVHRLARTGGARYLALAKWVSMIGFRGHFSTKSRRYSTTLGRLRSARKRWAVERLRDRLIRPASVDERDAIPSEGEDTTLVVSSWSFDGIGWLTAGDAALAATAAAQAREWTDERAKRRRELLRR
ncbi:replication initiation protein [Kineococcus sp. R8]|uniref:replication initiator n=1 Tax=Kineococcus siccus TaxID=2696567 RepID=UPI001411B485|nr:replication initiator [Kineococcus siccus]NAZ80802.1 replication initiation protein [Kineococcus siccus]